MAMTPLESFSRFLELTPDLRTAYSSKAAELLELMDPFLANPGQHREHVRLIAEAAFAVGLSERIPFFNPFKWGPLSRVIRGGFSTEYLERVARLKASLLEAAQPGEFGVDVLPSRIIETPPEWPDHQLHLLEVRVAVHPSHNLIPEKVSVALQVPADSGLRFIDCLPSTAFAESGEHEVAVTSEGKFVRAASASASLHVGVKSPPVDLSVGGSAEAKRESSSTESKSFRFKFQSIVPKTISSAVGGQARWELLHTADQLPLGGLKLVATLLAPRGVTECHAQVRLAVSLADWGVVPMSLSRAITLSRQSVTE